MEVTNHYGHLLLLTTFLPLLAGIAVLCASHVHARLIALVGTSAALLASLVLVAQTGTFATPERITAGFDAHWIHNLSIRITLGMDGLSGALVLLTNVMSVISILCAWKAVPRRRKEFFFFLLVLQTGVLGTFLSLDLILFYIFWETMMIPFALLVGVFGGERRVQAAIKFMLFSFAGSVAMLLAILALFAYSKPLTGGVGTFSLPQLLHMAPQLAQTIPATAQAWIFFGFMLAFAIKVPLFPLHTWMADVHAEAPTLGAVDVAGVLLKVGIYGFLRIAIPLLPGPADHFAPLICTLAIVGVIYGALAAFHQTDIKRLIAFSSLSHMSFITLGVFAFNEIAVTGAALQVICHAVSTGGLFICAGFLYERRGTLDLREYGGLAFNMKVYAVLTGIMVLSSVGLPGLSGFAGEFPILLGTFQVKPVYAVLAGTGVILAACYLLKLMQMVFFGPLDKAENKALKDITWGREGAVLVVLAVLSLWIGVYSRPFTDALAPAARTVVTAVEAQRDATMRAGAEDQMTARGDVVAAAE